MANLPYMNPYDPTTAAGQGPVSQGPPPSPGHGLPGAQAGAPRAPATYFGPTMTHDEAAALKKQAKRTQYGNILNPTYFQTQMMNMLQSDPEYQRWHSGMNDAFNAMGQGAAQFENDIGSQQQWMGQADAAAQKYGQAATQGAMMDIARQGAMSSRGGMTPAAIRQAMMSQGQASAGMQAQIAAQRMQARQEAQRAYLAARQQALQNRQAQFGAAQGAAAQASSDFGGAGQLGMGYWTNQISAAQGL